MKHLAETPGAFFLAVRKKYEKVDAGSRSENAMLTPWLLQLSHALITLQFGEWSVRVLPMLGARAVSQCADARSRLLRCANRELWRASGAAGRAPARITSIGRRPRALLW